MYKLMWLRIVGTWFSPSLPPSNGSEGLHIAAVVVPVVLVIIIAFTVLIVIIAVVYTTGNKLIAVFRLVGRVQAARSK